MATNRWRAKANHTKQVNIVTPAAVDIGDTFTVTINGKDVVFTATAATVANVTAGLVALLNAEEDGEFQELTFTDSTTHITITANVAGVPFTQTSSSTGGTLTTTADGTGGSKLNESPNDNNDADNWTDGIPTASDDLIFDAGGLDESIWWNLGALSALTMTSITRRFAFGGEIALPEYNETNATYFEYRATEWAISATTFTNEQPASDRVAHIKWNAGSAQCKLNVFGQGGGTALEEEQMWFRGTHVSNVVNVVRGSLAIAPVALNSAVVATLRGEEATIRCGPNCTLTTIENESSLIQFENNVTTLTQDGDTAYTIVKGAATITTATINEGTLDHRGTGTLTTLTLGPNTTVDWSGSTEAVTITNQVTFPLGLVWRDPNARVTFTNGFKFATGVRWEDCEIDMGPSRTHTVS